MSTSFKSPIFAKYQNLYQYKFSTIPYNSLTSCGTFVVVSTSTGSSMLIPSMEYHKQWFVHCPTIICTIICKCSISSVYCDTSSVSRSRLPAPFAIVMFGSSTSSVVLLIVVVVPSTCKLPFDPVANLCYHLFQRDQ